MNTPTATVARRLQQAVVEALQHLRAALTAHPVEMLVALHAYIAVTVEIYSNSGRPIPSLLMPYIISPIFIVTAYCLNALLREGALRMIYRLWWIPYLATALIPDLTHWLEHTSYYVTVVALLPLLLLSFRMRSDNSRYVAEAAHMALSAAIALLFASVALLTFYMIYLSVTEIFDLTPETTNFISSIAAFAYILLAPMIFFAALDRRDEVQSLSATGTTLLNTIISPALIIYTAILYLYTAKIVVTWTLPKGTVAGMVFAFSIAAVVVKALQQYVPRRRYDWFFDRFSLISLPLIVLFWIGTARRISEYGLTESRFYLVLCGVIMTLCLLLFLARKTGRYLTVSVTAFVLFAATAYIPPISAKRLSLRSQMYRADAVAQELGIADADGRLCLGNPTDTDTSDKKLHRKLYQSLEYIERHDAQLLHDRYGLASSSDYLHTLSRSTERYATAYREPAEDEVAYTRLGYTSIYLVNNSDKIKLDIAEYSDLSLVGSTTIATDSLGRQTIEGGGITIHTDELLDIQMAKIGYSRTEPPLSQSEIDRHAAEILVLDTDSLTVVFRNIDIDTDDQGAVIVRDAIIDFILHK